MNYTLEFLTKNHISSDIWQLHFAKPEGLTFLAGQYLEAIIPDKHPDERGTKRWFTISAAPTSTDIVITTRLISEKHSEFKDDLFHLKAHDTIEIEAPMGDFVLPERDKKILWIAGGIGVTPFISQMQFLLDSDELDRDIVLLHGLRSLTEDPCAQLTQKCSKKMSHFERIPVLSQDIPEDWKGQTGYITAEMILRVVPDYLEREVYISGPEPMVDAMKETLLSIKTDEAHIHQDWFPGYMEKY